MASRRELLRTVLAGAVSVAASPLVRGLEPPKPKTLVGPDLTDRERVIHVLNRMSFGFKPGEVDHIVQEGGWQAWVKQQLAPDSIEDSALDKAVAAKFHFADKPNILRSEERRVGKERRSRLSSEHT